MENDNRNRFTVPLWEKYLLTITEAAEYFNIGEKKIRLLASENMGTEYGFALQVGGKVLINRQKFEHFLNDTSSL